MEIKRVKVNNKNNNNQAVNFQVVLYIINYYHLIL